MQAAICQMRSALQPGSDTISGPAYEQLKTSTIQATSLKLCMAMCNPAGTRRLACLSMAAGSITSDFRPPNAAAVLVKP